MADNIFQQQVTPLKPKVLAEERVYVYVPRATSTTPGIASFNERDFGVDAGQVSLKWPEQQKIENADPLTYVSEIKVLDDEFEHTGNPAYNDEAHTYESLLAEVKLKRTNRNAFIRPDLVMLDNVSDFETSIDSNNYVKYTLKRNNPLVQPSLIQVNTIDFTRENNIVKINWPYAHTSGNENTNGYGLVKILANSQGGLKYDTNGNLEVDIFKVDKLKPTYSGNSSTGFDVQSFVGEDGYAIQDEYGYAKVAITKEAIGLNKVANKSFDEYTYDEFGQSMKSTFNNLFDAKLDKTTWNALFNDWNPPTIAKNTPQKWLTLLDEEDESIWESLTSLRLFLGYYEDLNALEAVHPANRIVYGSTAFLLSSETYWAVKTTNVDYAIATDEDLDSFITDHISTLQVGDTIGIIETDQIYEWDGTQANLTANSVQYEWYDTEETTHEFVEMMETDASVYRADGVASAGTTGKWAQSDHRHPTDLTRLAVDTYNNTIVNVTTQFNNNVGDFTVHFNDAQTTNTLNIPYVRKGQTIHNWNGQTTFTDTEASSEHYWRGTKADLDAQSDDIPNNTVIMVEDATDTLIGNLVTEVELATQGLTISNGTNREQIVIVNNDTEAQSISNRLMTLTRTLKNGNYRYALTPKVFGNIAGKIVLTTNSGDLDLATSNYSYNHPLQMASNGVVTPATYSSNNVVVISDTDSETNWAANGHIMLTNGTHGVTEFATTIGRTRLLAGNSTGGISELNLSSNKYLQTNVNGEVQVLATTASDAGKVLAIDNAGNSTLRTIDTLPITVVTTNPTSDNTDGMILCTLSADPGSANYREGVLYMW